MNTNKAAAWGKPSLPRYRMEFKVTALNAALGSFSGLAAAFGNLDKTNDIIEFGAFQKTLQAAYATKSRTNASILWPICWMHDAAKPVGAVVAAHETRDGLQIDGQLDLDTDTGRMAFSGLQKGYASGMSIGYDAVRATRDNKGVRHLLEVRLWEVSLVTSGFAANDLANVEAASVKADRTRAIDQHMARLDAQVQGLDWRSQRLPLQGNPAPAVYYDPSPSPDPTMPRRAEFVTDRLWHEALDDWAAQQRGPDAGRAARARDQREFDAAVARARDARVRAGRATFGEQEAYARAHGHTGDGRPAPDTDAAATAYVRDAFRALEAQRDAYHAEHGYTIPTDDDR